MVMVYLELNKNLISSSTIDTVNNKVITVNAIDVYTSSSGSGILDFVTITNPQSIKTTDSFQILLKTTGGYLIASKTTGITYTATIGAITSMSATPDSTTVNTLTPVLFRFKPTHRIPVSSQLKVTIPSEASIAAKDAASCSLSELSEIQTSATCTVSGRVITISSPFVSDFVQDGTKTISFKIGDVTMPGTTKPSSAGTFTTCYLESTTCYNIDSSTQSSLLTSTVGTITSASVTPTSLIAYANTKYTFQIVPGNALPTGSKFKITFPSEVAIPNPTLTQNS